MSSTKRNSNLSDPQTQKLTRRRFLSALAVIGTLPLVPHIVGLEGVTPQDFDTVEPPTFEPLTQDPIPQTADELIKRLSDLSITMAVVPIWLHSRLNGNEDPLKVLKQYDEAYEAAEEYQRLILTPEFDQLILAPLCGGPERYAEILHNWEEPEGVDPEPVDQVKQDTLDLAIVAIEVAAKR